MTHPVERPAADFTVLFVCTANLCRSPLAEFLLREQVVLRGLDWDVRSAGVQATPGAPMHPLAARVLDRHEVEIDDWTSTVLTPAAIEAADLILTATDAHRGAVARLVPSARLRSFTLLQLAHLARAFPQIDDLSAAEFGPSVLAQASRVRGRLQPLPTDQRDLADPMGQSFGKFRKCATVIERSLEDILRDRPRTSWNAAAEAQS